MDGTRMRRTKDHTRQGWYARHRQARFARMLGFTYQPDSALIMAPRDARTPSHVPVLRVVTG